MTRRLRFLLLAVCALLAICPGMAQAARPAAAGGSLAIGAVAGDCYDGHHALDNNTASEQGPPVACERTTTHDIVGLGSYSASARPGGATTATTYTTSAALASRSRVTTKTGLQVEVNDADLSVLRGSSVAANAGTKLLPKVDSAFQFPGAGRSGAGVKNFVGPPNTIARGASPGRVFVTDDQGRVIFDVTRDRVKPVVPGQGFVSGDERKLTPTSEQLSWIDELWGG